MAHLPPVGWLDVTTNQQLSAFAERMDGGSSAAVDARFDTMETRFNARFEGVDARFHGVDARFERVDARFERVDARFDAIVGADLDARFGWIDARFDAIVGRSDARFEMVDAKLDVLRHEFGEQLAVGLRDQLRGPRVHVRGLHAHVRVGRDRCVKL